MFIAWRNRPIKGRGGGPAPLDDLDLRHSGYAPPWRGVRCEHHGGGRAEWTPFVARSERRNGRLQQEILHQFPAIRSCCIADEFSRALWWHDLDWAIKLLGELGDGPLTEEFARARATIIADLRDVVRKPTPAGIRDFAAFRAAREIEEQVRDEANRAYWDERARRYQGEAKGDHGPRSADHFAVLGLKANATLAQVKARHRVLVMQHHPDRGGDPARFRAVQAAYERAAADLERPATR